MNQELSTILSRVEPKAETLLSALPSAQALQQEMQLGESAAFSFPLSKTDKARVLWGYYIAHIEPTLAARTRRRVLKDFKRRMEHVRADIHEQIGVRSTVDAGSEKDVDDDEDQSKQGNTSGRSSGGQGKKQRIVGGQDKPIHLPRTSARRSFLGASGDVSVVASPFQLVSMPGVTHNVSMRRRHNHHKQHKDHEEQPTSPAEADGEASATAVARGKKRKLDTAADAIQHIVARGLWESAVMI